MIPQSPSGTLGPHSSPRVSSTVQSTLKNPLLESPSVALLYSLNLIDSLKSLPFQKWFEFWENPEATKCQIWTIQGLSHLGDLMFCQKILCRFIALLAQSFWMQQPYSTHAHSVASTTPWPVQCSRHCSHMLIRVHSPWLPGYTNVAWTNFTYSQWLNFFWTDLILHKDVYILQT